MYTHYFCLTGIVLFYLLNIKSKVQLFNQSVAASKLPFYSAAEEVNNVAETWGRPVGLLCVFVCVYCAHFLTNLFLNFRGPVWFSAHVRGKQENSGVYIVHSF